MQEFVNYYAEVKVITKNNSRLKVKISFPVKYDKYISEKAFDDAILEKLESFGILARAIGYNELMTLNEKIILNRIEKEYNDTWNKEADEGVSKAREDFFKKINNVLKSDKK